MTKKKNREPAASKVAESIAMQMPAAKASCAKSGARAPNRPFTGDDCAELRRLYRQGHGLIFIGVEMGRSETTIKRWAARLGLREAAHKHPWTDGDKEILRQGIKSGVSLRVIAKTLDRSYNAVQVYVSNQIKVAATKRVAEEPQVTAPHVFLSPPDDIYALWCRAMDHVREQANAN